MKEEIPTLEIPVKYDWEELKKKSEYIREVAKTIDGNKLLQKIHKEGTQEMNRLTAELEFSIPSLDADVRAMHASQQKATLLFCTMYMKYLSQIAEWLDEPDLVGTTEMICRIINLTTGGPIDRTFKRLVELDERTGEVSRILEDAER